MSSCCDPRQHVSWKQDVDPKFSRNTSIVPMIESHYGTRAAIDCRIQHHVVVRVAQSATPQKMRFDLLDHVSQTIKKLLRFGSTEARCVAMLGSLADCLVLDEQCERCQQYDPSRSCRHQDGS